MTQAIAVDNANLFWSLGNHYSDGSGTLQANNILPGSTYAQSINPGSYAYLWGTFAAGDTPTFTLDTTSLQTVGGTSTPQVSVIHDGVGPVTTTLSYSASPVTINLASSVSAGVHKFTVFYSANQAAATPDRWNTPLQCVKFTGFQIGDTSSLSAPTLRPYRMLCFGDSITEGRNVTAWANYTYLLAWLLDAEWGNIGFGQSSWAIGGSGNVPKFYDSGTPANSSIYSYSSGKSRMSGALFASQPDYISICHGTNGIAAASDVSNALTAVRTAAPNAFIFVIGSPNQTAISTLTTGYNNYVAASGDRRIIFIDLGTDFSQYMVTGGLLGDTIHPTTLGHAVMAAKVAKARVASSFFVRTLGV